MSRRPATRRRQHAAPPRGERHKSLAFEPLEDRRLLALDFQLLKDINATPNRDGSYPSDIVEIGGNVFFRADSSYHGRELWKSDGTEAGTVQVKDIRSGVASSLPYDLTVVGGTLYFVADDGISGRELWKSDGTEAGTVRVMDINPGSSSSLEPPTTLVNVGGTLYFSATDGESGDELWKSDGTQAGTVRVRDIVPGSNGSRPHNLINVAGTGSVENTGC